MLRCLFVHHIGNFDRQHAPPRGRYRYACARCADGDRQPVSGGTTVDSAPSARSALQKLAGSDYDVIVCATGLPDMDHVAFLAAIRAHRPQTPILVVSTQVHEDLLTRAALHQVFHFVPKPIQPEAFIATLLHLFEHARLQGEIERLRARAERSAKRAKRAIALSRLELESRDTVLEHRQDALDQCRAAETRLTRILNGVPVAVVMCDPSWSITFLNDAAARQLARPQSRETMAGQPLWDVFPGPGGSAVQQACRKAAQDRCEVQVEVAIPGSERRRHVTVLPLDGGHAIVVREFAVGHEETTVRHGPPPRGTP
jgi:CheY-like chemotaxis protein